MLPHVGTVCDPDDHGVSIVGVLDGLYLDDQVVAEFLGAAGEFGHLSVRSFHHRAISGCSALNNVTSDRITLTTSARDSSTH